MFLKSLTIFNEFGTIREIPFHKGLNLIVDESEGHVTGNSVGKTTVLKLIDFCLGAKPKIIYEDPENKKEIYHLVKKFLIDNKIIISLLLTEDLDDENAKTVTIERNFLERKNIFRRINGRPYPEKEFELKLKELLFPSHNSEKPTLRQIISHNVRYKDLSIINTLRNLDSFTSDAEYETLHLFLLGCEFDQGNNKQQTLQKIEQEKLFKKRLEKQQTKSSYETALSLVESEIIDLNERKPRLNINENFEEDLNKLNTLKYKINLLSNEISNLSIRKDLIHDAEKDLLSGVSEIDTQQLKLIYTQASSNMESIQKTFEELVQFHNSMIIEKTNYITKELPELQKNIDQKKAELKKLLKNEEDISTLISKSDSFSDLEDIISSLNEKYRKKGEYEQTIQQIEDIETNITSYEKDLIKINKELFSEDFENRVKQQVNKFNKHFSSSSDIMYGEKYALKYDIITNKKGQKLYKFSSFNTNFSSGKKQGEISCFDIAYTLFADEEEIPCMHFLLNDKKELMHDNQLVKVADLVNNTGIQFVASILKDKLPDELNNDDYFILKLSDDDKLFRIENS